MLSRYDVMAAYMRDMISRLESERRRAALERFIKDRGLKRKIKGWCERADVPPTAIYNFLNGQSNSLSDETYRKLARSEGIPVFVLTGDKPAARAVHEVTVRGKVQAGAWREAMTWPEDDWYSVSVELPEQYIKRAYGLEVQGPSMDLIYAPGSVAICIPIEVFRREIQSGDHVVVERTRTDGLIEATIKEYQIHDDGMAWLMPRSRDPRHQRPIPAHNGDPSVEQVRITGVVIGAFTRRPNIV